MFNIPPLEKEVHHKRNKFTSSKSENIVIPLPIEHAYNTRATATVLSDLRLQ